jgi:thiosulfate/3-mercaptopyruvate sulfurtransferase
MQVSAMEPLVSARWVAEHLGDPDLRVIDPTMQISKVAFLPTIRTGLREYRRGHIPGSVFLDLFELHDPGRPRMTMTAPPADHLAAVLGSLGVDDTSRVILYDRRESMWSARVWWLLRAFGHDRAAILDGGWGAWQAEGLPECDEPCAYPSATFEPRPRAGLLVDRDAVLAAIDDPHVALVNALGRRQHRGEVNEYGRRGHIPGSVNITAWEVLDRETGRYRSVPELRAKVGSILDADRVIIYCGAGAAASSLAHVLTRLGHRDVAVYDGGLVEWCDDRDLPLERGA